MAEPTERYFDFTRKVAGWLLELIRKTYELLTDNRVSQAILNAAGVRLDAPVNGPNPNQAALDAIQTFVDTDGAADLAELVGLLESIDSAIDPLRAWLTAILSGSSDQQKEETIILILKIVAYIIIKRFFPAKYKALEAAGLLDDGLPDYEAQFFTDQALKELWNGELTGDKSRFAFTLLTGGYFALELIDWVPEFPGGMLFGWQTPEESPTPIADEISSRTLTLTLSTDEFEESAGLRGQFGIVTVDSEHGGPGVMFSLGGAVKGVAPLGPLVLEWDFEAPAPVTFFVGSDSEIAGSFDARSVLTLSRDPDLQPERPTFNFGESHLSLGHLRVRHTIAAERIDVTVDVTDTELFLMEAGGGGFVNALLPEKGLNARFTLGFNVDLLKGKVSFSEGTSLRAVIPVGGDGLLGVRIPYVTIDLADDPEKDELETVNEISATVQIEFGTSASVTLERLGVRFFIPGRADKEGLDRYIAFKPPTGAGFSLNAKAVTGGGYLFYDEPKGEWGGVVHLDIKLNAEKVLSLTALGLVKEGLPGAPDDFALIVAGSVELDPGLGPFFGMYLQGLGLLFAHNRTIDTEYLRQGVKTGLIDSLLFPSDPIANAPQILNDMRRLFPVARNRRAIAFLLKIGFGSGDSARLKLGVAIDWPDPNTLAILGSLTVRLPKIESKKPAAQILADAALIWDEAAQLVSFDAALRDSFVSKGLTLTGEMAARWHYGDPGAFVLSIGGLHPGFNASNELPANAQMPRLERLALALGSGSNPRVRAMAYLAITPNTVQGGLRAEVIARKSGFTLEGWIGADALFQRDPFRIVLEISAGVKIRKGQRVLFSLTLEARFEGFGTTRISGKVKFKILFVSIKIPVSYTFSDEGFDASTDIDLAPEIVRALDQDRAWGGSLPEASDQVATFGLAASERRLALRPSATPSVRQGVAPLGLRLDLYQGSRLSGAHEFRITEFLINGQSVDTRPVPQHFAPAQYFDLSDDAKLSRPSFESYDAGVEAREAGFETGAGLDADLGYETILIDQRSHRRRRLADFVIDRATFAAALPFAAAARPRPRLGERFRAPLLPAPLRRVAPADHGFVIATTADLRLADALTASPMPFQAARARLDAHLAAHPDHAGRLQIVNSHQVA